MFRPERIVQALIRLPWLHSGDEEATAGRLKLFFDLAAAPFTRNAEPHL